MINNMGTKVMEAIWFGYRQKVCVSREAMKNMKRLRILYIREDVRWKMVEYGYKCQDGSIEYLPNNLRWLVWHYYPWELLPAHFEPKWLVHVELVFSSLHHFWTETTDFPSLRTLNLSHSESLIRSPDFTRMPNLEYLNLEECSNLEEVHHSLGNCRKLIRLNFSSCRSLKRFPCINVESLEYLNLRSCCSLEKFPKILGRMKLELEIFKYMQSSGIREVPSCIQYQTHLTKLDLSSLHNLVALPSTICRLKSLVTLDVSSCEQLEILPEEIGDLENLERLLAEYTLISRPPSSIVCLNKLKTLRFAKRIDQVPDNFVFPPVAEGLHSLIMLNLDYCNLIDGGLPEDIGCLSTLVYLYLRGNNFERLPQSIAQLGSLLSLDLIDCKRLNELPELPPNIDTLHVDFPMALKSILSLATKYKKLQTVRFISRYDEYAEFDEYDQYDFMFAESPFQHISALESLCQRVVYMMHPGRKIPIWFPHRGTSGSNGVSINLPGNWYVNTGNFLGFAICCYGIFGEVSVELVPLCDTHPKPEKLIKKLASSYPLVLYLYEDLMHFIFIPLASLWDTSKANGATPSDYGHLKLSTTREIKEFGYRLLYRDEPELDTELCIGVRSSRYGNCQHLDAVDSEACCSSSSKQTSSSFKICALETLHLYPETRL